MRGSEDPERVSAAERSDRGVRDWINWGWHTDHATVAIVREIAISVVIVLAIAGLLFSMSGVWPPLVAVESDSMEPNIMTGDLVFIVEPDRFAGEHAINGTGIVPGDRAAENGSTSFGDAGDVIIFAPDGNFERTPIIHRAKFYVEEGEDWTERANPTRMGGMSNCDAISNCPAPHDGFITHGDNTATYDQIGGNSAPVKADWVIARAELRVPFLGRIRLFVDDVVAMSGVGLLIG